MSYFFQASNKHDRQKVIKFEQGLETPEFPFCWRKTHFFSIIVKAL